MSKFSISIRAGEIILQLKCLPRLQIVEIPVTLLHRTNYVLAVWAVFFGEDETPGAASSLQKHETDMPSEFILPTK